jgi:hypothetical protein
MSNENDSLLHIRAKQFPAAKIANLSEYVIFLSITSIIFSPNSFLIALASSCIFSFVSFSDAISSSLISAVSVDVSIYCIKTFCL